jgi:hypothetical protein
LKVTERPRAATGGITVQSDSLDRLDLPDAVSQGNGHGKAFEVAQSPVHDRKKEFE